jgi:hypothetical protein
MAVHGGYLRMSSALQRASWRPMAFWREPLRVQMQLLNMDKFLISVAYMIMQETIELGY